MPPLRAGLLSRRVAVEVANETSDSFGQKLPGWSEVASLRAWIRPISGNELVVGRQVRPELTHVVTVRNPRSLATITPEHRLRFDDPAVTSPRYFGVLDVRRVDERLEYIEMDCKEIVGDPGT